MMRAHIAPALLVSTVIAVCLQACASRPFSADRRVREQELIGRAKAEIVRRGLPLSERLIARVGESTTIIEIAPFGIAVYDVAFYDPRRNERVPVYDLSYVRSTGELYSFGDFRVLRHAS
jgi:hypothetical protein